MLEVAMPRVSLFSFFVLFLCCAAAQESVEKHLKDAIALHQSGKIEPAIAAYRQYLKLRPDSLLARSNLGAALARVGQYDDAIDEYTRALGSEPKNVPVLMNLALAYFKTNRIFEAAEKLELVKSLGQPSRQVILLLADCYLGLGRNKDAITLLSPLEKSSEDDLALSYLMGTALVRDGQAERGSVFIDRILRKGESAEARLLLGTTKMFALDYPGALPDLKRAVELNPNLPEVHSYYGQALLRTGDPAGSAAQFRAELALNPNNFMSNLELGVLAKEEQKYADAGRYFERAMQSRPGDPGVRYQIATMDLALGKEEKARVELESLVKEAPEFTEAHVSLATVYYRLKRTADGDRERAIVRKLLAEQQAKQPGVNVK